MDVKYPVANSPKTSTFQTRINPNINRQVEDVNAKQGFSFTDAVNIFIQQSTNSNDLPFLVSSENEEFLKAKAMWCLMNEFQKGWESGEKEGWVILDEAEALLGVD